MHAGNVGDFAYMIAVLTATLLLVGGWFLDFSVLASGLLFAVIYVWSKRSPDQTTSFYGMQMPAAYLPFVLAGFTFITGGGFPVMEFLGILAGHVYYFVKVVLPDIDHPLVKGKSILFTPDFVYRIFGAPRTDLPEALRGMAAGRGVGGGAGVGGGLGGGGGPAAAPGFRAFNGGGRVLGRD
jgi:hypothetical protein